MIPAGPGRKPRQAGPDRKKSDCKFTFKQGSAEVIRTLFAPCCLAATLLIAGSAPDALQAQNGVAIVDINRLFETHAAFKPQLDQLRTEAESLQATVAQKRDQLRAQAENLALVYQPGTAEYSEKEKSLAMENARIELDARDQMRNLMRREARLHYDVYLEITGHIARYSQANGLPIVLRHSPVAADLANPEAIMRQVNAEIVWSRADRDITPAIQQLIGQSIPAAGAAPAPGR